MALNPNQIPTYIITPRTSVGVLSAATAGSLNSNSNGVSVFSASASGSRVYSLIASTTDTANVDLYLYVLSGATVMNFGQVNIPLRSGDVATSSSIDCLDPSVVPGLPIDNTGKRYVELASNNDLKVSTVANMTAGKVCTVMAMGGDYQ